MSSPPSFFTFLVGLKQAGKRLDSQVAAEIAHCSRSYATMLIRKGCITVDGSIRKPSYAVKAGETVSGLIAAPETPTFQAEDIALQILYEDSELLVLNKMPGMVVHPSPGHARGTLVNALMHHCPDLTGISGTLRPGIVHRLDKDTSGALAVAKTNRAMHHLSDQFKSRQVRKRYLAMVYGIPETHCGTVDRPIGRHPQDRKKMSVTTRTPREALTHWQVREQFAGACLLEVDIQTGRTHQIRVHCLSIGHPVIGDPVYFHRGAIRQLALANAEMARVVGSVDRQMLHAWKLKIRHPVSGDQLRLEAPLPDDMAELIDKFRENLQQQEW